MKTIWKYHMPVGGKQILVPERSKVLSFGAQNGDFFVWVEINKNTDKETFIRVNTHMTGEEFPDENTRFIGTAEIDGFVLHAYQVN